MIQKSQPGQPANNLTLYSVKYEIKEDPFNIPIKFKREVPLNKNIFELNQSLPKKYDEKIGKINVEPDQMLDPLEMKLASIKLQLIEKLNFYLASFSIILSIYQIYAIDETDETTKFYLALLNCSITVILIVQIIISVYFYYEDQKARRFSSKYKYVQNFLPVLFVLFAPTPWTPEQNYILHLTILLRLYFPFNYFIRSNMYYEPRAARITNIYGMKPQTTFWFTCKATINNQTIAEVLIVYITVVLLFSHSLFIVSSSELDFIDCFQVVLVTLPTVGFGQYSIEGVPRLIIILILVTGIAMNAFVTLVMLKSFEMTTNQSQSYLLLNKLKIVEQIQQISSDFIIRKIRIKGKKHGIEHQKDDTFKENYKSLKSQYRSLNPRDCMYHFSCFRTMINQLNVKSIQTNNMTTVLVSRLVNSNQLEKKNNNKEIPHSS